MKIYRGNTYNEHRATTKNIKKNVHTIDTEGTIKLKLYREDTYDKDSGATTRGWGECECWEGGRLPALNIPPPTILSLGLLSHWVVQTI